MMEEIYKRDGCSHHADTWYVSGFPLGPPGSHPSPSSARLPPSTTTPTSGGLPSVNIPTDAITYAQ